MDNEPGAQVHEAQSHSSVEQSEDAAHDAPMADSADSMGVDAARDAPMDDSTNPMQVPDINAPAQPFRFGNLARGLFNWRKRNPSSELDKVRILR
jgi:hypothetical protein